MVILVFMIKGKSKLWDRDLYTNHVIVHGYKQYFV